MSSNSSFSLPISDKEMFKAISDFLLSDDFSPIPDDLVHRKMLEYALELSGENKPDEVAKLFLGMTRQQVEEHFASRHSVNMLPEPEPEKEKATEREGIWSEEEKRLFQSGLEKYGWGKWKNISRHIGTRSPEQVRSFSRRATQKQFVGRNGSLPINRYQLSVAKALADPDSSGS